MAIMIPTEPYEYTEISHEGEVFNFFKKNLPDEYYVFHSFKTNNIDSETNELSRHEIDFLIFHPALGIICIEVKHGSTGKIVCENRKWYFLTKDNGGFKRNEQAIPHGGPFRQAEARKEAMATYIGNQSIMLDGYEGKQYKLKDHCKVTYAVCLPGMRSYESIKYCHRKHKHGKIKEFQVNISEMLQGAGTPNELVIFRDDLEKPSRLKVKIDKIYSYKIKKYADSDAKVVMDINALIDGKFETVKFEGKKTEAGLDTKSIEITDEDVKDVNHLKSILHFKEAPEEVEITTGIEKKPLSKKDEKNLFDRVLCPNFNIVETVDSNTDEAKYIRLNEEQIRVLDILMTKKIMAVSGMAGTGKTILALKLARKKVMMGEKVLFLCRSYYQKMELEKDKSNNLIDFRDIDWFTEIEPDKTNGQNFYDAFSEKLRLEKLEEFDLREKPKRKKWFYDNKCQKGLINPVSIDSEGFCKEFEEKDFREKSKRKEKFRYNIKTIIVDEAQDFCQNNTYSSLIDLYNAMNGQSAIQDKKLKQEFKDRIKEPDKSLYIFYDEFQTDNDSKIKICEFAQNIKNHIELEKNCRNTINIARTALRPFVDIAQYNYCQRKDRGTRVRIDFYDDENEFCVRLDHILQNYKLLPQDTAILTLKSDSIEAEKEKRSVMLQLQFADRLVDETGRTLDREGTTLQKSVEKRYKLGDQSFLFTNWKNFQGLEKRNVIIVDFDQEKVLLPGNDSYSKQLYVCMTRAQEKIYILSQNPDTKISHLKIESDEISLQIAGLDIEDEDGVESTVANDYIEKIKRACTNDSEFMHQLGNAIKGGQNLKVFSKKTNNVPPGVLKRYYELWLEKADIERRIEDLKGILEEAREKAKGNLDDSFVHEYSKYSIINRRAPLCEVLNAESINDKDIVINDAFRKLYKLGKEAIKIVNTEEIEKTFHERIKMMISAWEYMYLSFTIFDYEYSGDYYYSAKERHASNLDLKRQIEMLKEEHPDNYRNVGCPVGQGIVSYMDLLEEFTDYQLKGVDLQSLWEGYQHVQNWREDNTGGVIEKDNGNHVSFEICNPLEPFAPEFWDNFELFMVSYLKRHEQDRKEMDAFEAYMSIIPDEKIKNLKMLEQKAIDCFLGAELARDEFNSDRNRHLDWDELSYEKRMYGYLEDEKYFGIYFSTYYFENLSFIQSEEENNQY